MLHKNTRMTKLMVRGYKFLSTTFLKQILKDKVEKIGKKPLNYKITWALKRLYQGCNTDFVIYLEMSQVLANEAWNFVHREFPSIKSTEDFLACDLDDICLMVGSDDLNVAHEEEVRAFEDLLSFSLDYLYKKRSCN